MNEKCINPCVASQCGQGAECLVYNHRSSCECPKGTQGDPQISCISGHCQYNEDCADHEACDRLNRVCRPVCDKNSCGKGAYCVGTNHAIKCSCNERTYGDPYVECRQQSPTECSVDADCPSKLACINDRCTNPCTQQNVCSKEQTCSVLDSLPLRILVCKCPPETVSDERGNCKPISREAPACTSDFECPRDTDVCRNDNCVPACRVTECGSNAQCTASNHRAVCTCPDQYKGNPYVGCTYSWVEPAHECTQNDDCPFDRTCNNNKCVNPCKELSPCGRGAFCFVERKFFIGYFIKAQQL